VYEALLACVEAVALFELIIFNGCHSFFSFI
jgi:hypothetical protein